MSERTSPFDDEDEASVADGEGLRVVVNPTVSKHFLVPIVNFTTREFLNKHGKAGSKSVLGLRGVEFSVAAELVGPWAVGGLVSMGDGGVIRARRSVAELLKEAA